MSRVDPKDQLGVNPVNKIYILATKTRKIEVFMLILRIFIKVSEISCKDIGNGSMSSKKKSNKNDKWTV